MKRLNMRQLEAFRAAMVFGGITKAAEALDISQPAASRLLQDLSQDLGFPLFYRDGVGSLPTKNAEIFFTEVDRLFIGIDELHSRAEAINHGSLGKLTMVAASIHANGLLPEIISAFLKEHGDILITLESQPQERILDWVASRRCEIGFTNFPVQTTQFDARLLATRSAVCVLHKDNALAQKKEISAKDLDGEAFVAFPRGSPFRFRLDSVFERAKVQPQIKAEARTHEGICGLVAFMSAVSVVSPFSRYLSDHPALVTRPFKPAIPFEFGMLLEDRRCSTQARKFADFASAWFAKESAA